MSTNPAFLDFYGQHFLIYRKNRTGMLDKGILDQVKSLLGGLKSEIGIKAVCGAAHTKAEEFSDFLKDFCSCSDKLKLELTVEDSLRLEFTLYKDGADTGIVFRGIPGGHEFSSLLLAVLNADGQGKNMPDDIVARRIRAIGGDIKLRTYVSLTCTNCPDVVQALNVVALLNPLVSHEVIDGALWQDEVERLGIQGVPSVYAGDELIHVGRGDLSALLSKLEEKFGTAQTADSFEPVERSYDVVVVGGGPAGASAAIYSARKGLRVAVVGERVGGQVKDTVGIENLISVPHTTGDKLASDLMSHLGHYAIDVFENRTVVKAELGGKQKYIHAAGGESFVSPAVIIATGASWRRLGVEGEADYIGRGVAFCPHCDGPFYKGRHVAVIGGGNSGIEAAIDLAGICSKVTVLEFADELRADNVLQDKARSLDNVEIFTSMQTMRVIGDGKKVTAIEVKDRKTEEVKTVELDGIFVQIGLAANSKSFEGQLELTPRKEIKTDAYCRTSIAGVYAAGDVTDVPYKQIIIAMGEGAKAALSAFDDRVRGLI